MRIRIRLLLPDPSAVRALGYSALAHLLLGAGIIVAGAVSGAAGPPPKVLTVRLSAGAPKVQAPAAPRATSRPKRAETPEPTKADPPAEAPKPKPKPKRRTDATAPKTVETTPEAVSARPEELETVEAPPEPEPAAPEGSGTEAGAPVSSGVAGGVETDEPFTADWYVGLIVTRLTEAWRDRPVLPAGSAPRRVVVAFTIRRDGRVENVSIRVPSGYAALDYSARRAASSLGRLPPLPRSYEKDSLSARFVFELVPPER